MPRCLFERATGLYEGGTRHDDLPHDTGTHIQLLLPEYPDRRTERWDGAVGVRAATAGELTDFDDAVQDKKAVAALDMAINMAIRDLLLDIEQRLRAAGQTSTLPDIAAANTKPEYNTALKTLIKTYL